MATYGPYFEDGVAPAQINVEFDISLHLHDARWGIRQRADVDREAATAGMYLRARHAMPANNLLLAW